MRPWLCVFVMLFCGRLPASPLPSGRVTELHGTARRLYPDRPLALGARIAPGDRVVVDGAEKSGVELTFDDGGLLRLSAGTEACISKAERTIQLFAGRALIQADRMLGGIAVLTDTMALTPEGTTYLVEILRGPSGTFAGVEVRVLEGAIVARRPRPTLKTRAVVLPGERLRAEGGGALSRPVAWDLSSALAEPLIAGFSRPLPSRERIAGLADQQRRGVLAGRNQRLRKELFWHRFRHPIVLPELFRPGEGDQAPAIIVPRKDGASGKTRHGSP